MGLIELVANDLELSLASHVLCREHNLIIAAPFNQEASSSQYRSYRAYVPMKSEAHICLEDFQNIMNQLGSLDLSQHSVELIRDAFWLAVVDSDASIVYYRIGQGMVKPVDTRLD